MSENDSPQISKEDRVVDFLQHPIVRVGGWKWFTISFCVCYVVYLALFRVSEWTVFVYQPPYGDIISLCVHGAWSQACLFFATRKVSGLPSAFRNPLWRSGTLAVVAASFFGAFTCNVVRFLDGLFHNGDGWSVFGALVCAIGRLIGILFSVGLVKYFLNHPQFVQWLGYDRSSSSGDSSEEERKAHSNQAKDPGPLKEPTDEKQRLYKKRITMRRRVWLNRNGNFEWDRKLKGVLVYIVLTWGFGSLVGSLTIALGYELALAESMTAEGYKSMLWRTVLAETSGMAIIVPLLVAWFEMVEYWVNTRRYMNVLLSVYSVQPPTFFHRTSLSSSPGSTQISSYSPSDATVAAVQPPVAGTESSVTSKPVTGPTALTTLPPSHPESTVLLNHGKNLNPERIGPAAVVDAAITSTALLHAPVLAPSATSPNRQKVLTVPTTAHSEVSSSLASTSAPSLTSASTSVVVHAPASATSSTFVSSTVSLPNTTVSLTTPVSNGKPPVFVTQPSPTPLLSRTIKGHMRMRMPHFRVVDPLNFSDATPSSSDSDSSRGKENTPEGSRTAALLQKLPYFQYCFGHVSWADILEFFVWFAVLLIEVIINFNVAGWTPFVTSLRLPVGYLTVIVVYTITMRCGLAAGTLAMFITGMFAISGSKRGEGPFWDEVRTQDENLMVLSMYLITSAFPLLAFNSILLQLHELERHLERRVFRRTKELKKANRRMQTAMEQAERGRDDAKRANEAKSLFLSSMSHEIRTPMNGVVGMTELLLLTRLTKDQQQLVESIKISSDHLLVVINDILDFSKIESGKLRLTYKPFLVQDCIEQAIGLAYKENFGHLDVAFLIDPKVPRNIVGDVTRVRQVLVNLLANALKFTHSGGVTVRVEVERKIEKRRDIKHVTIAEQPLEGPQQQRRTSTTSLAVDNLSGRNADGAAVSSSLPDSKGTTYTPIKGLLSSIKKQGSNYHALRPSAGAPEVRLDIPPTPEMEMSAKAQPRRTPSRQDVKREDDDDNSDDEPLRRHDSDSDVRLQASSDSPGGNNGFNWDEYVLPPLESSSSGASSSASMQVVHLGEGAPAPRSPPQALSSAIYLLKFSVRDTGVGIPHDKFDRLFKVFSQVDGSSTREYGGTGLGLVICARLTAMMQGKIKVHSVVGKGSTFSFTIQAKAIVSPEPPSSASTSILSLPGSSQASVRRMSGTALIPPPPLAAGSFYNNVSGVGSNSAPLFNRALSLEQRQDTLMALAVADTAASASTDIAESTAVTMSIESSPAVAFRPVPPSVPLNRAQTLAGARVLVVEPFGPLFEAISNFCRQSGMVVIPESGADSTSVLNWIQSHSHRSTADSSVPLSAASGSSTDEHGFEGAHHVRSHSSRASDDKRTQMPFDVCIASFRDSGPEIAEAITACWPPIAPQSKSGDSSGVQPLNARRGESRGSKKESHKSKLFRYAILLTTPYASWAKSWQNRQTVERQRAAQQSRDDSGDNSASDQSRHSSSPEHSPIVSLPNDSRPAVRQRKHKPRHRNEDDGHSDWGAPNHGEQKRAYPLLHPTEIGNDSGSDSETTKASPPGPHGKDSKHGFGRRERAKRLKELKQLERYSCVTLLHKPIVFSGLLEIIRTGLRRSESASPFRASAHHHMRAASANNSPQPVDADVVSSLQHIVRSLTLKQQRRLTAANPQKRAVEEESSHRSHKRIGSGPEKLGGSGSRSRRTSLSGSGERERVSTNERVADRAIEALNVLTSESSANNDGGPSSARPDPETDDETEQMIATLQATRNDLRRKRTEAMNPTVDGEIDGEIADFSTATSRSAAHLSSESEPVSSPILTLETFPELGITLSVPSPPTAVVLSLASAAVSPSSTISSTISSARTGTPMDASSASAMSSPQSSGVGISPTYDVLPSPLLALTEHQASALSASLPELDAAILELSESSSLMYPSAHKPRARKDKDLLGGRYPLRILVAEDNSINQKLVMRMLKQLGYTPDIVANGQEAVDAAAIGSDPPAPTVPSPSIPGLPRKKNPVMRKQYDIIFMDRHMPVLDGCEATRRILSSFRQANVNPPRIIAMTAGVMDDDHKACADAGMHDYVAKPFTLKQIEEKLINHARAIQPNAGARGFPMSSTSSPFARGNAMEAL